MSALDDIRIEQVPPSLVGEMWPHVEPHLRRGLKAATDLSLERIYAGALAGQETLWGVFENDTLRAAFLTATFEDDNTGADFLGVYGLGGNGVTSWAAFLDRAMQDHAKACGVPTVRFCGRQAWSRVLPALTVVGERGGATVYERAAS